MLLKRNEARIYANVFNLLLGASYRKNVL